MNTPENKLNNDKSWCDENSRYSTHDNINELIERGRGGETTRNILLILLCIILTSAAKSSTHVWKKRNYILKGILANSKRVCLRRCRMIICKKNNWMRTDVVGTGKISLSAADWALQWMNYRWRLVETGRTGDRIDVGDRRAARRRCKQSWTITNSMREWNEEYHRQTKIIRKKRNRCWENLSKIKSVNLLPLHSCTRHMQRNPLKTNISTKTSKEVVQSIKYGYYP